MKSAVYDTLGELNERELNSAFQINRIDGGKNTGSEHKAEIKDWEIRKN